MARNKLEDLRNHLFAQLERLNDEELTPEQVQNEVKKAKAIADISDAIIDTAKLEVVFLKETGRTDSTSQFFKGIDGEGVKQLNNWPYEG